MNIEEFYNLIDGDYKKMLTRVSSPEVITSLVIKFVRKNSYIDMINSIYTEDYKSAFEYAHNLKGVAANLSFVKLSSATQKIVEQLRSEKPTLNQDDLQIVKIAYQQIEHFAEQLSA